MDHYRRNSQLYAVCTLVGVGLVLLGLHAAHLYWVHYVGIALAVFGLSRSWTDYRKRYCPKTPRRGRGES